MPRKSGHKKSTIPVFHDDIKKLAKKNLSFRKPICTGTFSELVVISILPMAELGEETHDHADEILFIVEGEGELTFRGRTESASKHDAIFVPAGQLHNLKNIGERDLKLISVFSPPPSGADTPVHRAGAKTVEEQMRYAWEM